MPRKLTWGTIGILTKEKRFIPKIDGQISVDGLEGAPGVMVHNLAIMECLGKPGLDVLELPYGTRLDTHSHESEHTLITLNKQVKLTYDGIDYELPPLSWVKVEANVEHAVEPLLYDPKDGPAFIISFGNDYKHPNSKKRLGLDN
jgi:hypothetical protein